MKLLQALQCLMREDPEFLARKKPALKLGEKIIDLGEWTSNKWVFQMSVDEISKDDFIAICNTLKEHGPMIVEGSDEGDEPS